MIKYIIKRFFISILTLFVLITACFFLLRTLPGNPFQQDIVMDEQTLARLTRYYGLDKPLIAQYFTYLKNLFKGDLGYSYKYPGRTVNDIIAQNFPISADLGLRALIVGFPAGMLLGSLAARFRGKALDYVSVFIAIIGISVPSFVVATMLQWIFGVKLQILPIAYWRGFTHTILPVFAMSLGSIASEARAMRANMLEVSTQDYLVTAKAKGLSQRAIMFKHQIRNALVPMLTGMGLRAAGMIMGSLIIEQIFVLPGLGLYYTNAIKSLDYTMVMGLTIFYGSILIAMNFIVDLGYGLVDPRIRIQ